ncbi:MAG: formate dehydrogenase accessory sulfurtransferase FdhD [Pseudomonadota bacterium]|nr:formate dehydrogenase accessory sulfurtransferase FdhD [Pseudomonadota bacterium]
MIPDPAGRVPSLAWRGSFAPLGRSVAEETPIALSYNRLTHAVMMATPADLEDFAVGFSRSEAIIQDASDIEELEIVAAEAGVECRMWVSAGLLERLEQRRRSLAGPTGCGLCGLESLAEAVRTPPTVGPGIMVSAEDIQSAMASMPDEQRLNHETRAVHAAGFWQPGTGLLALREDVGRHNALDKLSGALARAGIGGQSGMIVMTSRISVELVQKAAAAGSSILVAVSAPTRLALRVADAAGITLVGIARRDGFEVFTHTRRIIGAGVSSI